MRATYISLFFLFISFVSYSQYGNRNQRQRQRNQIPQTQQKAPDPVFQVEKYIGIVIYDIEKAAKKSRIKLSSDTGKKFATILTSYNKDVKDIRRINSFTMRSTKELVENFQKNAIKTGDVSKQAEIQKTMMETLKPISETLKVEDKKLDKSMKEILSKKQYKKWIKYNRKMYKYFPQEEDEE